MHQVTPSTILALDVGERRVGVARASTMARLPSTLTTLQRSASTADDVKKLMSAEGASILVVGLPRGLNGQHTAQTEAVQTFGRELEQVVGVPLQWQDEAVTSRKAEAELESRGKPYQKGDIDALSAVYILEDFLRDHPEVS
ncbi:MAG TPA: Holliday junction resolvase RuvX [Candidatus Saccharimonadales bacterium]|nr:Holliday junction resolvase RuvX [Candidatus Saccharimonadales bacterium]